MCWAPSPWRACLLAATCSHGQCVPHACCSCTWACRSTPSTLTAHRIAEAAPLNHVLSLPMTLDTCNMNACMPRQPTDRFAKATPWPMPPTWMHAIHTEKATLEERSSKRVNEKQLRNRACGTVRLLHDLRRLLYTANTKRRVQRLRGRNRSMLGVSHLQPATMAPRQAAAGCPLPSLSLIHI